MYPVLSEELGFALDQFNSCFESQQYLKQVEQDAKEANDLGIKSQPNLIIWYEDGSIELIDGYVNRSYLESILSDHL
ncbi:MAG: hypothetical protein Q8P90_03960 [bacterium]|nr:hypothetical protein [bacterium]